MYQSMKCLAFSSVAFVMAGCAATATTEPPVKSTGVDSQQRIEALETQLRMKDQELSKMRSQQAPANDLFPPNPKAGECYARVLLPAKYRTAQEQVVARQESERVEVIPAQYETVDERVLIPRSPT